LSAEILQARNSLSSGSRSPDLKVNEFCTRVADITTMVVCDAPGMDVYIDGATRKFLAGDVRQPDVRVRIRWDDLSEETSGEKIFDSGALWQLYRQGESRHLFRFATPYFGAVPYKLASFDRDFTEGEVRLHRPYFEERAVYPLEYPLDELLMLNLLARGRGAEFHSCGVVDGNGEGRLFLGQSGAGKTTTARLWEAFEPGAEVLSDDRIILRKEEDGRFYMYGTPWHGEAELSAAGCAPLKGIYFLRHGTENRLTPLSKVEAAAMLFSCSFPTFYHAAGLEFTLGFYEELATHIECRELSFQPLREAVEFVRSQG
jgi:hypothetical protein